MVRLSRCCTPVPGDEIMGFVTRGRGVSVHRTDCANAASLSTPGAPGHRGRVGPRRDVDVRRVGRGRGARPFPAAARRRPGALRAPRQHPLVHVADGERPGRPPPLRLRARRSRPPRLDPQGRPAVDSVYEAYRVLPGAASPRLNHRHSGSPRARDRVLATHAADDGPGSTAPRTARRSGPTTSSRPSRDRWIAVGVDVRGAGRALRLRAGRHADLRALRGVPAGRRVHRRRAQGDVRVHRQGRPAPRAAARGHRARSCGRTCSTDPTPPWKVWYVAPNFRYERPQKGRYRQHWQLGAEVLGVDDPDVDVEVIALAHGFYRDLGSEAGHAAAELDGRRRSRGRRTSRRCRRTCSTTPPRSAPTSASGSSRTRCGVLDSKRDDWQDVIERAPQLTEHLGDEAEAHFEQRAAAASPLSASRTSSRPRLVRGFDYYTSTTFEFASDALDAAQNAVGGGGRYDQLAEEMGGPPTPGIGFGIGIERVLIACDAEGAARRQRPRPPRRVRDRRRGRRLRASCSSPSCASRACAPTARTVAAR